MAERPTAPYSVGPSSAKVHEAVATALSELYRNEGALLADRVAERTLVGHFAGYLRDQVTDWEGGWSIDTEYNRMSPREHGDVVYKHLNDVLGRPRRPAYPDLIIHLRGVHGLDGGNLLVVEAKTAPGRMDQLRDHAKIVAWMRELHYRYGLRLELRRRAPLGSWIEPTDDDRSPKAAQDLRDPGIT